ncbi:hypothetical protein SISNIDRAFT_487784 [Sistotremastrum niveocremeum HHB9708]|uniref:Mucoidy inhibitor A n=1 Tax=Sistotremastrum niveocremeum HHB9708 TaxID=1314777 RepID=A0A164S275_9AGAM|nr:hypothetical protein SISNIDRAFT_487784 [Sistotremastrum niveocremeum HHB9708]
MSQVVTYDASEHPVNSVTVYQVNRAEINRRIKVNLASGQNEVEIIHLPSVLDEDSIRVDGIGKAVIFDVIYKPPMPTKKSTDSETLKALLKKKALLDSRQHILEREDSILTSYSNNIDSQHVDSQKLAEFFTLYQERKAALDLQLLELQETLKDTEKEIEEERKLVKSDKKSQKRGVKIVVVVLAEEDGPAELSLSYVVSSAQWKPQYDLRASISNSQKSKSSISLQYRASIWQSTGEDWDNVDLHLSTASPQMGSTVPGVKIAYIREDTPVYYRTSNRKSRKVILDRSASFAMLSAPIPMSYSAPGGGSNEEAIHAEIEPPPFMTNTQAVANESAISASFNIEGLSSIPSDTDEDSQTHKVTIAVIELDDVSLEWIAVPKELPSAFLQCRVKNTSPYLLLPGPANIFMDNNFVSKSEISQVSSQESFSCSLGVDPEVRVVYHPQRKWVKTVGGLLTSKVTTTSFTQTISLKNNRRATLKKLIVKDNVPVSSDSRIKVVVSEPKGLEDAATVSKSTSVPRGAPKDITLGPNLKVRWAPTAGSDSTSPDDGSDDNVEGTIEWTCVVEPGSSQDLQLSWDVVAPAGVRWTKTG